MFFFEKKNQKTFLLLDLVNTKKQKFFASFFQKRSAFLLLFLAAAAPAPPWEERYYNPKPAPGDLALPIPCGGALILRPVAVPAGNAALDDRAIQLGSPSAELGFNEYQRGAFLAAPFTADGTHVFYIGKYAVTRDQYAAVTGTCPAAPTPRGRIAQADISWFDAVNFTQLWSSWLLANARDKLPRHGQAIAFVRLPTEEEWEYAARGGASVSESDYLAPTWPMPEGIERYAVAGAGGSDGRPQQVGQMLPNPLGLYDMLGNVEQWVLDPYRLNRVGRLQGQTGGLVARGGSYATPLAQLRSSMREEIPPFDPARNAPTHLAFIGFRVALAADAGGGLGDVAALRQAFEALQHDPTSQGDDPQATIARLKQQTADPAIRQGLDRIGAQLATDARGRADAARESVRAQMEAATALAYVVWRVQVIIRAQQAQLDNPAFKDLQNADDLARVKRAIAVNQADQQTALDGYARLLREAAIGPAAAVVADQARILTQELRGRADRRTRFVEIAAKHLAELGAGRPVAPDVMLKDIVAVPAQ